MPTACIIFSNNTRKCQKLASPLFRVVVRKKFPILGRILIYNTSKGGLIISWELFTVGDSLRTKTFGPQIETEGFLKIEEAISRGLFIFILFSFGLKH